MKVIINIALAAALALVAGTETVAAIEHGQQLRGDVENSRQLADEREPPICPDIACYPADPCEGQCEGRYVCVTEIVEVLAGCLSCPKFVRCDPIDICHEPFCVDPCHGRCTKKGEYCVTEPGPTLGGCPGCPVFVECKMRERCGSFLCPANQVCCNPSCGICTPPTLVSCSKQLCTP